ncbi:MAG: hypothetical protein R3F29_13815 [Planctomycetota bacterium]
MAAEVERLGRERLDQGSAVDLLTGLGLLLLDRIEALLISSSSDLTSCWDRPSAGNAANAAQANKGNLFIVSLGDQGNADLSRRRCAHPIDSSVRPSLGA